MRIPSTRVQVIFVCASHTTRRHARSEQPNSCSCPRCQVLCSAQRLQNIRLKVRRGASFIMATFVRIFIVFACLLGGSLALAQLSVQAPPERFVAPGEFVTLVFRISAEAELELEGEASSEQNWTILRQPGSVALAPGRAKPVAVTVTVPEDAAAFSTDTVTLELAGEGIDASAAVTLTVNESRDLDLIVPNEVVLSDEGFVVIVDNQGNVAEEVTLELSKTGETVEVRELQVEAKERLEQTFFVEEAGSYLLILTGESANLTKSLSIIQFGVPPPEPLLLGGEVSLGVSTDGSWGTDVALEGPLSDFALLEARLSAPDWRRSFAEVETETFTARVGNGYRTPFRLRFPADFGLAGSYTTAPWTVAGAAGWVRANEFSGYALGNYEDDITLASVGLGLRSGRLLAGAHLGVEQARTRIRSDLLLREGVLNASLNASGETLLEGTEAYREVTVALNSLFEEGAGVQVQAGYVVNDLSVSGDASLPLSEQADLDFSVSVSDLIATSLPGQLGFGVQAGFRSSFANLRYYTALDSRWRTSNQLGVVLNDSGFGVTLNTFVSQTGDDFVGFDAQLTYYPGLGSVQGRVGARAQASFDAVELYGNGGWDLTEQSVGLTGGAVWRSGAWRVSGDTDLSYSYAADTQPLSFSLSVEGSYLFTLPVPERISDFTGGRRVGTLIGEVKAGDIPIPGVEVRVGRYRILTGEDGTFEVELPPESYEVRLDIATLPVTYRLQTAAETTTTVVLQEKTTLTFEAVETAALRGRVLQDSDADGTPDDPPQGSAAQLTLLDADGLRRVVTAGQDGTFEIRGLVPGEVSVTLANVGLGTKIVGPNTNTFELSAGVVSETQFLVQPANRTGKSFTSSRLRIRSLTPEVDRVPAGTAPRVEVVVSGEAESVVLETPTQTVDLTFDGEAWVGRVPLPADAPAGVFSYTALARAGDSETSRRGQIVIDSAANATDYSVSSPVRPGTPFTVEVTTYFDAQSVTAESPLLGTITLESEDGGSWTGSVAVPEDAADDTFTLTIRATRQDGVSYEEKATFRVLAPQ